MRKRSILALILCLCLSLCACGGNAAPSAAPESNAPIDTSAAPTETEALPTETEPAPAETESAPAETESDAAPETSPAEDDASIHGGVDGDYYTNEVLKLRIRRPSGWIFYNEEQLAQTNNLRESIVEGTDVAEIIAKSGQFTDMMMTNAGNSSVNVLIQPMQAALSSYSDQQIFQLSEETVKTQMGAIGMEVKTYEAVNYQVGGESRDLLHMGIEMGGAALDEYQIWYRTGPDYMAVVTVAILDDTDLQTVLDGITSLE